MVTGKFAISVHILTLLASFPDDYLTSGFLADSINVNPVLVRKEIANLRAHELVESKEGKNGGTRLLVSPAKIGLATVFRATVERISLGFSKNEPNPSCTVGRSINAKLGKLYEKIDAGVIAELENISLEDFQNTY